MKEKLDEQQRQLQKQLAKYENNEFDDFEKAFEEPPAAEAEDLDDARDDKEEETHPPIVDEVPSRAQKGVVMDIPMMDEEGTLKEKKLKKLEDMKRRKLEELDKRKRDHTPT